MNIYAYTEQKIVETIENCQAIMDLVDTVEARKRDLGTTSESLTKAFSASELPAVVVICDANASTNEQSGLSDQHNLVVGIITIVKRMKKVEAEQELDEIVGELETLLRQQRSSVNDFSGHGGITMQCKSTYDVFRSTESAFIGIATTELSIYWLQSFNPEV